MLDGRSFSAMTYQVTQNDAMHRALPDSNVLIVEDNALLACDLHDVISDTGAHPIGPAFTLESGLELARKEPIDIALLDINLGDDLVWPLAHRLNDAGIPFAFLSAACRSYELPGDLKDAACIDKPATPQEIVTTLDLLLAS